jgi:hypothetical protein
VTACLDAGKFVLEEPFEVTSDTVGKGTPSPIPSARVVRPKADIACVVTDRRRTGGPAKGRKSEGGRSLFEGYSFYLHGSFQPPSPAKDDLKTLITTSGGTYLSRSPPSPAANKKATKRGRKGKSTAEADHPTAVPRTAQPPRPFSSSRGFVSLVGLTLGCVQRRRRATAVRWCCATWAAARSTPGRRSS